MPLCSSWKGRLMLCQICCIHSCSGGKSCGRKTSILSALSMVERINIKCAFAQCAAEAGSKHCALFPALKRGSVKRLLQKAFAAFKQPEECVFINEFSAGGRRVRPAELELRSPRFRSFQSIQSPKTTHFAHQHQVPLPNESRKLCPQNENDRKNAFSSQKLQNASARIARRRVGGWC